MDRQVTYDSKSFIIGGKREFLCSGAIHYFRSPHESWRHILSMAKLGGLNTIETYVAWNFHEYDEGIYDFAGDRDLDKFLSLCEEIGLYAIVRPGPYICAEWDFGGFPWWLANKEGVVFRTDNPVYLQYVDRWFDELFPIIVKHQFSKGGMVIAVQVENEYNGSGYPPEMAERYQGHLRDGFKTRGVDVPLLTCAGGCSGTIECANAHRPSELFADLRKRQPDAPLFSTEFWGAWYDVWGGEHKTRDPKDVYNETLRIAARGGSGFNYYMWHGGTNFGYTTMYLQTTSYDSDAPLSEAGAITEKFRATKLACDFLQAVAPILTEAGDPTELPLLPEGIKSWVRQAGDSSVVFLENTTDGDVTVELDGAVLIPAGEVIAVAKGPALDSVIVQTYTPGVPNTPSPRHPIAPLVDWQCSPGSPEASPDFDDSDWQFPDKPTSMLLLGNKAEAYGWYRTEINADKPGKTTINFSECADILTLFVNGEHIGSSHAPPENRKPPWAAQFQIELRAGRNVIAVLADNLGLAKGHWQIGKPQEQEAKGIFAPVTLSDGSEVNGWKFLGLLNGERADELPWQKTKGDGIEWHVTWWGTTFDLDEIPESPVFLDLAGMRKGVIWLNGRNLGRYWDIGPQKYYFLPKPWLSRKNVLVIVNEGDGSLEKVRLVYADSATSLTEP